MAPDGYDLVPGAPSAMDYVRLRRVAGLSPKPAAAVAAGLAGTWLAVRVRHEGAVVGMGRVVGDGGCFFQLVDIAVDPAHQGRGLGHTLVATLMRQLRDRAPSGAYVSLIADGEAHRLYAKFGFAPTAPASIGMALTLS